MKLPIWTVDRYHSVTVTKGCAMHTKEGWFGTGNYIPRVPVHVWVRDSEPAAFPQIPEPPKWCIDLDGPNLFGPYCMPPARPVPKELRDMAQRIADERSDVKLSKEQIRSWAEKLAQDIMPLARKS